MKGKKGNLSDVFTIIKFAVLFAILASISLVVLFKFNDAVASSDVPTLTKTKSSSIVDKFPLIFDFMFLMALLIPWGFSLWAASKIPSDPLFITIIIFVLLLLGLGGIYVENFWDELSTNAEVSTSVNKATIFPFLLDHFTIVVLLYALTVSMVLLSKDRGGIS